MSIDRRLDRLESARGDERPNLVIYETDTQLSPAEELTFLKANIPDISPTALVIAERRPLGCQLEPPRVVLSTHSSVTHEDAIAHFA